MIIIGERLNGAIPEMKEYLAAGAEDKIRAVAAEQAAAGADFLDCAPSTATETEYEVMCRLIDIIQSVTDLPISIDSPDAALLARIITEGRLNRPGLVNSVNGENAKCDLIFPLIAGTDWQVIGLCCDNNGIPAAVEKKLEIAKRIIDRADHFGVALSKLHIDPCVMSLPTMPGSLRDLTAVIRGIHAFAPEVKVAAAISNMSFNMPGRDYVNLGCMAYAIEAGLDTVITDPRFDTMMGLIYACDALLEKDKGGRKYNRAYRQGRFGRDEQLLLTGRLPK